MDTGRVDVEEMLDSLKIALNYRVKRTAFRAMEVACSWSCIVAPADYPRPERGGGEGNIAPVFADFCEPERRTG